MTSLPKGRETPRVWAPLKGNTTLVPLEVELSAQRGLPQFNLIGLAGPEVNEARERVRSAIRSIGLRLPQMRITVNLSPSNLKKHGTSSDLAIALRLILEFGKRELPDSLPKRGTYFAFGELGLHGELKPTGDPVRALRLIQHLPEDSLVLAHPVDLNRIS